VLDAFLAVRALRVDRGIELDRYYLGNLRIGDTPLSRSERSIPRRSRKPAGHLIPELYTRPNLKKPAFVAGTFMWH
jgi:hypothetical protein